MLFITITLGVSLAVVLYAWWAQAAKLELHERQAKTEMENVKGNAARTVKESERRLGAIFDHMHEGVILLDSQAIVQSANRAAGEMLGCGNIQPGRTLLEATRHHELADVILRLRSEKEILGFEFRVEEIGAARFIRVNAVELRNPSGASEGALLVLHDMTQQRKLESVRQEFVANVSHELRTPLSLIKGATETLINGAKNDPATSERFLGIIDRHADRLTLLINDILLLSSLDAGKVSLKTGNLTLGSFVSELFADLQAKAASREMKLQKNLDEPFVLKADADRLRQVFTNLIDNAIKYGRQGGSVLVGAKKIDGGLVEIFVRDDGPGIPAEALPRVFERFYRVDRARSRDQGGTGLGLAIVKHVVQSHGGTVRVESTLGEGSTFFFTIPAAN